MKRLAAVLLVFVPWMVLTSVAAAQDVEAIKAATLEHFAAFNAGDAAAHARHHLPEWTGFGPDGGLLEESSSLEDQESSLQATFDAGLKFNLQLRHLKVKVYGNTAVVKGYAVGTVTSPDGGTQQVTTRRTAVLIKQRGQWREVHSHNSPLMGAQAE